MLRLSAPQNIFLNGLNTKFRAYVGGFGSGKTFVGCLDLLIFAARNPGIIQGYFAPTYPSIRDIFYPTFEEAAELLGFTVDIKEGNKELHLFRNGRYYGTIICRSMDNPSSIIGFKLARALVDEIDTLPKDKARRAWNKIIARLRLVVPGVENGIGVTTTPEGFLFCHSMFAEDPKSSYSMVQASTYENAEYLPPDYISSLLETYPEELISAYINGEFVNLTAGSVYKNYDRIRNRSVAVLEDKEPLNIGMDFNVTNMSAVVYVVRDGIWHGVEELKGLYDTPAMIDTIKQKWGHHSVTVYPDASGASRKSVDASISDIALLQQAGFKTRANKKNPKVKDRVMSANGAFGRGDVLINEKKCPETAKCLEQLAYDQNGEPDKKSGLDHLPDAATYPIAFEMPVLRPITRINVGFAL